MWKETFAFTPLPKSLQFQKFCVHLLRSYFNYYISKYRLSGNPSSPQKYFHPTHGD